ncbi:hypothetical protein O0I10_000790 [Lichtheimia ornata]|uniref:SH3 domain-containing protein n=1 Tax=Lichtheimia ornata TaxID=688661 RepID=A0AAD7Y4B6_9FUNG|nr:uncharacterized protein O0I10_000790 [Lichtheimia ornata]KAJ8663547.1 hypothetical protein O0I10_000790 [Lichtheimia ornata]
MKKKLTPSFNINSPIPTKLAGECKKAARILNGFIDPGEGFDKIIPPSILANAKGLAIYTVLKGGFLFTARGGSGLVVARLPDGSWSAPSAIATGGIGAGGQIGAELTDFVLVLNTKEAVKTFSHFGSITLGTNISVAAGPIGRNAEASGAATLKHIAAIYSYSKTRGLFAGVSLEGSVIITRSDANTKMYGRSVTAKELLNGTVPPPPEADALYRALGAKFHTLGNTAASYRRGDLDENGNDQGTGKVYRSTTISKPGTLKRPPAITAQARSPPPPAYHHQPAHSYDKMEPAQPSSPPTRNMMPASAAAPSPPPVAPRRPMPPPVKPREPMARALYPYKGEQPGDLSFEEGQVIVIIEKTDSQDDWWTGKIGNQTGVFPANYVQLE